MPWRLEFEGEVFREDDLTLDEHERIADLLGRPWAPHPITSAKALKATLAVCLAGRGTETVDAALLRVGSLKTDEFLSMIKDEDEDTPTEYVDGNPPKADEDSTPS